MLKWCDGFEHYGAIARATEGVGGGAAWSQIDAGWALSTANPATGTYHLRASLEFQGHIEIRRIFGVASQIVGVGYRTCFEELPVRDTGGAICLADFKDVSNVSHVGIFLGTDGSIIAIRGPTNTNNLIGGTILGRSDPCIAPGGYHHFECKVKIANSGGYIEVRVNQVTKLNLTGIDTQDSANAAAAQVSIGQYGGASSGGTEVGDWDIDDVFTWNDDATDPENTVVDFVGDKGAYWEELVADTATNDFDITGAATAHAALDEVPPSGTDYLSTEATTARAIITPSALPGNVTEVIAWMPVFYVRKEESGSVTMRGGLVSGTDETYGPDDDPSTAYAYLRPAPKTTDPATGVPWDNVTVPDLLIERTA